MVVGKPLTLQSQVCASSFQSRFFETTGLDTLATLIQRYKMRPHPKFAGELFENLKERKSKN